MAAGRDSASPASRYPSGRERAALREQPGRLVMSNATLSIAFAAAHGTILSLYDHRHQFEFIDAEQAAAEGSLWRLKLAREDGSVGTVTSRSCARLGHTATGEGGPGVGLRLQWDGLRIGASQVEGQVVVEATLPADASAVVLKLRVALPQRLAVRSVEFPGVWAVGSPDLLADESVFVPLAGGAEIGGPRAALSADGPERPWRIGFPGPAAMQFLGYCAGKGTTLWLATGDSSGARKDLCLCTLPRSGRLALWITHFPSPGDDGTWCWGYPCEIGSAGGDWFEAAQQYRVWAIQQPWCARGRGAERNLPSLTSSYGLWLSHWGGARQAVTAARELQRLVNVPVKLDWRCWHRCAWGGAYPDYWPPRDGEEAFAQARGQLAEAGMLSQLSFSGLLASPRSEAWRAERMESYRVREPSAEGAALGDMVCMCPSTRYWRQKLAALAREAVQRGIEGTYLQHLGGTEPLDCRDRDHGHLGLVAANLWAAGVRSALSEVRNAVGRGAHLATDGPVEMYLDLVDAFLTSQAAGEREALLPERLGSRWTPIPLFASVYHGYSTLIGPGASLVNHRPHDPLSSEEAAELRLPPAVMNRDYQGQFCLEVARAAVWGQQLALSGFSPDQLRDETSRRKIAFLSTVLRAQAWGVGALLPFSEFRGLLEIEAAPTELEFLVNPPGAHPSQRRAERRSLIPVIGSAWRTPGAGAALILGNLHDQPAEFATRLRSGRLAYSLPLQPIGRTFSEDGDVAAATLRVSGGEISGRIPSRSVVLLTLR